MSVYASYFVILSRKLNVRHCDLLWNWRVFLSLIVIVHKFLSNQWLHLHKRTSVRSSNTVLNMHVNYFLLQIKLIHWIFRITKCFDLSSLSLWGKMVNTFTLNFRFDQRLNIKTVLLQIISIIRLWLFINFMTLTF